MLVCSTQKTNENRDSERKGYNLFYGVPPPSYRLCASLSGLLLGLLLKVLREADVRADGVLVPGLSRVPAAGVALVAGGVLF